MTWRAAVDDSHAGVARVYAYRPQIAAGSPPGF